MEDQQREKTGVLHQSLVDTIAKGHTENKQDHLICLKEESSIIRKVEERIEQGAAYDKND